MKFMLQLTAIAAMGVLFFSSSCKKDDPTGKPALPDSLATVKTIINFSDLKLSPDSFWNGADLSGGFTSGVAFFKNVVKDGYWSGFAYSNKHDTITPGSSNQYSTSVSEAASNIFALAFDFDSVNIEFDKTLNSLSLKVSNNAYAALAIKNGLNCKKFGGDSGSDPDWFKLTIVAYKNKVIKGSTEVYLADYTSADNTKDYILTHWKKVDLSSFGDIDLLSFKLSSTDNDILYGMNNPAYFCLDDIEGKLTK